MGEFLFSFCSYIKEIVDIDKKYDNWVMVYSPSVEGLPQ